MLQRDRAPRHFASVPDSVLDPIMGLDEAFRVDASPDKVNLVVGVYQTDDGTSPVLAVVKQAEERLLRDEASKVYVPMAGERPFLGHVERLLFGAESALLGDGRVGSVHTPGGTGALRLAGELIAESAAGKTVWIGDPAYPNHRGIFGTLGLTCKGFRYFDIATGQILEREMFADLEQAKTGDIVVLHGCCHNPSGADPTPSMWRALAELLKERELLPLIDLAYLGYASGLDEDTQGLRTIFEHCAEGLVVTSFSKNFSLYNERTGALSIVCADSRSAERCVARSRTYIRRIYSSPPAHGARIITTVLADPALRSQWRGEVEAMRQRMMTTRQRLHEALSMRQVDMNLFPGLTRLHGMFALTRLSEDHVNRLRAQHHIYMLPTGRISITGLTSRTIDPVADAIARVARP
jgi:aspartate/tyrosine/aromatic aminotransferase